MAPVFYFTAFLKGGLALFVLGKRLRTMAMAPRSSASWQAGHPPAP